MELLPDHTPAAADGGGHKRLPGCLAAGPALGLQPFGGRGGSKVFHLHRRTNKHVHGSLGCSSFCFDEASKDKKNQHSSKSERSD